MCFKSKMFSNLRAICKVHGVKNSSVCIHKYLNIYICNMYLFNYTRFFNYGAAKESHLKFLHTIDFVL